MSMTFRKPIDDETRALITKAFGKPAASDERTLLFDHIHQLDRRQMAEIARIAKQPAEVTLHAPDEIVTMSDGTRYQVTEQGWRKL